eukprot:GHVS01096718.1.p2 GENE.GHVS01096718.1~~GHVS01096718.1.p2  ORF type:complete len:115 (+),score=3.95 GHVS01096718.1:530-874(+)
MTEALSANQKQKKHMTITMNSEKNKYKQMGINWLNMLSLAKCGDVLNERTDHEVFNLESADGIMSPHGITLDFHQYSGWTVFNVPSTCFSEMRFLAGMGTAYLRNLIVSAEAAE